jgi:phospho-N-acetylmuramoyl-pentapeptide-transferase
MKGLGDFIPVVIFIITAVSNGANLTDGIWTSRYLSNLCFSIGILRSSQEILFSNYLNIMYIPNSGK